MTLFFPAWIVCFWKHLGHIHLTLSTSMDNDLIDKKENTCYVQFFQASLRKSIFLDRHYSIVVQISEMKRNKTLLVTISIIKFYKDFKYSWKPLLKAEIIYTVEKHMQNTYRCSRDSRPMNAFFVTDLIWFPCKILKYKQTFLIKCSTKQN